MTEDVKTADLGLERDGFMRALIGHLAETLQNVVGLDDAEGYVSVVGQSMGDEILTAYKSALKVEALPKSAVSDVLVDLKQRIHGDFFVIEETENTIVLGSHSCPFGELVTGRPALCMMTSNVFGTIAAETRGYARVSIDKAIAKGDAGCRVTIHFDREETTTEGREYFGRA